MNAVNVVPGLTPAEPEALVEITEAALDTVVGGAAQVAKPVMPRGTPKPPSITGEVFEGTGI